MRKLVAFFALTQVGAFAQAGLGNITGTVVDSTGLVMPGVSVVLTQQSTQTKRSVTTNGSGVFELPSILPGQYTIAISARGFREKRLEGIDVNGFQQISLNQIRLELGGGPVAEVNVTAEQELVKDSGQRAETIQARQVSEMPNNGRNWATLLKVIPGSGATNDSAIQGREYGYYGYADFSVNGKTPTQNQVNLDGGSIVDHGSDGKVTVSPSLESIQEISVLTNNFTAEYGNRSGATINIITKSGSSKFHGVAFENLRNEDLNANSWSNNYNGLPRNTYRYNYFGANLGGPIKKDKLFFFYNFEDFHQNIPGSTAEVRVPTALERNGDFSQTLNTDGTKPLIYQPGTQYSGTPVPLPNNKIPVSAINPLGQAILNLYPSPNTPGTLTYNYIFQYQTKMPRLSQVGRVDWNISDSTRAYLRYSNDSGTNQDLGIYNTGANVPFNLMSQYRPDRAVSGDVTHTFSSTVVFEGLFGWSYDYVSVTPVDPSLVDKTKLNLGSLPTIFPAANNILPGINVGGTYPTFGFTRLPAFADANEYQGSGTLNWTRGTHTYKFGMQYSRNTKQEITAANDKGNYDFSAGRGTYDMNYGPANALTGAVSTYTQVSSIAQKNSILSSVQSFAQDTWRARRNLTFDYGVRFYHTPAEYEVNPAADNDAVFLPWKYDPSEAPRFYVPDPANSKLVIDPADPSHPQSAAASAALLYSIVPGSGNRLNGVYPLGSPEVGNSGLAGRRYLLAAPRGGFAWSPGGGKSVIRSGFGWAYNFNVIQDSVTPFNNGLTNNVSLVQTNFANIANPSTTNRIDPGSFGARDPSSGKTPAIYDYSLSFQRQLPFQLVFDAAYIGNIQRHQPVNFNLNAIAPGTEFLSQYVEPGNAGYNFAGPISGSNKGPALPGSNAENAIVMRPYLGLNTLNATANVANNTYNSLQASLNKRFGNGLMFQAAYTLAKLTTQQQNTGEFYRNWKDYAGYVSATNRLQTLAINYIYELPKFSDKLGWNNVFARTALDGWQFTHLLTFFSGLPYTPGQSYTSTQGGTQTGAGFNVQEANTSTNVNVNNVFMGTPDLAPRLTVQGNPNASNPAIGATHYDPATLGLPAIYPSADGTGPRQFLNGPGTFVNDMSIVKTFAIHESKRIELRANFYNTFNQVRRTQVNSSAQYKANGATFAQGFSLSNAPTQLAQRYLAGKPGASPVDVYNQYRTGVGYDNLTAVLPMRVIEFGLKFRF